MSAEQAAAALGAALTADEQLSAWACLAPEIAAASYRMLFPEFVSYRGGWFIADGFTTENIDTWFQQPGIDIRAIERVVSHVHILEDNTFGEPSGVVPPEDVLKVAFGLAEALAFGWKTWARERYGVALKTFVEPNDEGQGVFDYIVSFESEPAP